ncbi:unnamed protein product [Rotaria magnacalcarata]|uniref:SnoaL-like domain-containing protein n=1 Tax=Rotaria magnacalcarata TaxID=392030 RepID=A0A814M029_9BILA|nr:unnamed protein product [Rotaria magnacalcarata]CAF1584414.1 unnamed protein product [Rotaria magnacalcarata]CAF2005441.1 unnamed protein product [Rotaria magnacalcarata]CAF2047676.1 unnamed protein product [Rotaria magnacalcarata]
MANTSTTVAIDTSIPSEKSALFQRNASPLEIGSAFEAEMKRLYCEGRLEEYARELYTDDCKLWTDDKRQLFGRNAVHQYLKEMYAAGTPIDPSTTQQTIRIDSDHFLEKGFCTPANEDENDLHYMSLFKFDENGSRWRCQWEVFYE